MLIKDLFDKPVDRPIEGVIKADDDASLRNEVDEYVPTSEATRQFDLLLGTYVNTPDKNGVWISGFFGSGKSHLLKMLALLLENRRLAGGERVLDLFLQKAEFKEDHILAGDLKKAVAIPSESILFNIDQKADKGKDQADALLGVFVSVFNEHCGYFAKEPHIAKFERDLDRRGLLEAFVQAYEGIAGKPWSVGREEAILESARIDAALAAVNGGAVVPGAIIEYSKTYGLSIEGFADLVREYVESKPAGFRLNFFVDEVGQFIAGESRLMLNLQTIAESLATRSRGRSWLFVTAQEDLQDIVGEVTESQGNDFSKIQARFKTPIKLTSRDVDEVIQRRLLWKSAAADNELVPLYVSEQNNFKTLFGFADGSTTYKNYENQEDFVRTYPFVNYQFTLFQHVMRELSRHGAFTGRYTSVGARSMLGVFQQVAIDIGSRQVGELAPFGLLFEGIRTALKTQVQQSVLIAEDQTHDAFAVTLLKALLLVKYVQSFKATERNLAVLMMEHFDQNISALRAHVRDSLALLEQQTWIMRNGEVYVYLTDEEKDIEQEIKHTPVATSELTAELNNLLFSQAIAENKFRRTEPGLGSGLDFAFTRKLDDQMLGAKQELGIHIVTPLHEHFEDHAILVSQSMGRDELLVILPPDPRFMSDLRLAVQTDRYVKHNTGGALTDNQRTILSAKGTQNAQRKEALRAQAADLLLRAKLVVEGTPIDPDANDARTRIQRAFWTLVERTYPKLSMLRGVTYSESMIPTLLRPADGLYGDDATTFSEAENEIFGWLRLNKSNNVRTTVQMVVTHFGKKPYGWPLIAVQANVAKLMGRGKIEARLETSLVPEQQLANAITSTRGHVNLELYPVEEFPPPLVNALRNFLTEFFSAPPLASDAKAMALETQERIKELRSRFEGYRLQSNDYPFLAPLLETPLRELRKISEEPWDAWFKKLPELETALYNLKEETLDPLGEFMSPARQKIYSDVRDFLNHHSANFEFAAQVESKELRTLFDSAEIYKGQNIQLAKAKLDRARALIDSAVAQERNTAINAMEAGWQAFADSADYRALADDQRADLRSRAESAYGRINSTDLIASIRYGAIQFTQQILPEMAQRAHAWAHPAAAPEPGDAPLVVRETVSMKELFVPSKPWLESEEDVDAYLASVRAALLKEVKAGKRISIH